MRIFVVMLLALTLMPGTSLAENKRVIDYYQQALSDYQRAITDLKAAHAEISAVRENAAKKVAEIDALMAKYEAALEITTQRLENEHEAQLKAVKKAYQKKRAGEAGLAELARQSAQDDAKATRAILDGLKAEKVAKLMDAVSVSSDGNVGIGTTSPKAKLEVTGTTRTQKLQLGKKWLLSGVGDVHHDDDWLRLFDHNGNYYYGGFAAEKVWTESGSVVRSDARLKRGVETLDNALNKLLSLRGVRFKWKNAEQKTLQMGVIAQEIEKVFPEIVEMGPDNTKGVNYSGLIAVFIEAIKEQQRLIEQMARQIDALSVPQKQPYPKP